MKRYTIGLITGVLLTASAFMFMGAQNKNLGDITVSSIKIIGDEKVNDRTKLEAIIIDNKLLSIYGKNGVININGSLITVRENKNFKAAVVIGMDDLKKGNILTYNTETDEPIFKLGSTQTGSGVLELFNGKNNRILYLGPNEKDHGLITLFDRYGDQGWAMTGKN